MKKLLSVALSLILLLGTATAAYAEEMLWTEQAGQVICKELSEGYTLEPNSELLSIPGMDQFETQIKANEDPESLIAVQMIRRCPLVMLQSLKQSYNSYKED